MTCLEASLIAFLLGGCDSLFNIDYVHKLDAAQPDAGDADARAGAYFVQGTGKIGSTQTPIVVELERPVHHGNVVVVEVCSSAANSLANVSDATEGMYATAGTFTASSPAATRELATLYTVIAADGPFRVTVTYTSATVSSSVQVAEYSNIATVAEADVHDMTSQGMAIPVTVTLAEGPALLVASACTVGYVAGISDLTLRGTPPMTNATLADKVVSGPGAATAIVNVVPEDVVLATLLAFKGT